MKIVDTFLFSEPHEKNILSCKLHAEYEVVDKFIAIESAYDFRGNYKGLHLKEVLKDSEFDQFLDQIVVLSNENSFLDPSLEKKEKSYFTAEFASRAYCHEYLCQHYSDDDWIILSDTDEMLDFYNEKKRDIILRELNNRSGGVQFQNYKFWWDFDNLNLWPDKYIPMHKLGSLKVGPNSYANRNNHCTRIEPSLICGLEYSYCFPKEGNWRKLNTFAHDRYTVEVLDSAFHYNTWHKEKNRGEQLQGAMDFFETIDLDETNATEFVLDNLWSLKVNTIDKNYGFNRMSDFSVNPHPAQQYGLMRGNKIKKECNYYRNQ